MVNYLVVNAFILRNIFILAIKMFVLNFEYFCKLSDYNFVVLHVVFEF